jgi:hypothetical protein
LKTTKELIAQGVSGIALNILVFGPQVKEISTVERTRKLQLKRQEIRANLESQGHHVKYAEDLVDTELSKPFDNPVIQEVVIMNDYDLIVTLVDSPGSIVEAAMISMKPNLSLKSSLFLDEDHIEGLVGQACRQAESMGADFNTYKYPNDLTECNLLGFVKLKVGKVQQVKYLT